MTIDYIRSFLRKQPFEAVKIWLSDGRSFDVSHPDFVSLPPEGLTSTFIVWHADRTFDIVSSRKVTSVSK